MTDPMNENLEPRGDSPDKGALLARINELVGVGDIQAAWRVVASYCVDNRGDAEMLAALREIERLRMRSEPSGTKLSFAYIVLNGMPLLEYSLKAIYDYAHEIIIVEGAVENCMFAANSDGSSTDGTVEFIRSFPDPDGKIRLIQGRWPEKLEMTNAAVQRVTGDYIWLIAADEVYRPQDIEGCLKLVEANPSITQVGLIPYNFWKGFDFYVESERFAELGLQFQGPIKFLPGSRFINHRPVQLKYPGYLLTADYLNRIDGAETRKAGIRFCHYNYVLESQVQQKIELYHRYGWGKSWDLDLDEWYKECFLKWTPENRERIESEYPVWTGDRNSRTVRFEDEHPEVMRDFIDAFRASNPSLQTSLEPGQMRAGTESLGTSEKACSANALPQAERLSAGASTGDPRQTTGATPVHAPSLRTFSQRPKYIKIETTNICNANCSFCAYSLMTRPRGVIESDLFEQTVRQYAAMGGGQITISPEVGDCLIDVELLNRLRFCRQFEQIDKLGFHTNLIGLDRWSDKQVSEMLELVTWWACSIGPNRQVYRDMFGVDQFERVVANLDRLHRLLAQSANKPEIEINGRACGGAFEVDHRILRLAYALIDEPVKWTRVYGDWGGRLTALPRNTPICRSNGSSERTLPCLKPLISAVVFHDGRVGFCGCADYDAELVIGDLKNESLTDILSGQRRRQFLEAFGTPRLNEYCRKCTFYEPAEALSEVWSEHLRQVDAVEIAEDAESVLSKNSVFGLRHCVKSVGASANEVSLSDKDNSVVELNNGNGDERRDVRRLLWVRTDSIGDNILAASMLPYIRREYRNAEIIVLCQDHIAELYEVCPHVDRIISFNRIRALSEEAYRVEIVDRLREVQADAALNSLFSREPITDIFTIGSLAKQRVALDGDLCNTSREAKLMYNEHYTKLIPSSAERRTELDRHRDFLEGLHIQVDHLQPMLWMNAADKEYAQQFFTQNHLDPEHTVALFPSAQHFHKVFERYDEVIGKLTARGFSYVILGGDDDEAHAQARRLSSNHSAKMYDLTGKTTIRQTAAIIQRCCLYVGADSAGAHMACAVETPNVVVLGGGHFSRFIPYSSLTSAVCLPLECYGCRWNCRYETPHCVKDISPELVAAAVEATLDRTTDKPRLFHQTAESWQTDNWRPSWHACQDDLAGRDVELISSAEVPRNPIASDVHTEAHGTPADSGMGPGRLVSDNTASVRHDGTSAVIRHVPVRRADAVQLGDMPSEKCDLSIVLCTRNRAKLLDQMLTSLENASRGVNYEVIVVQGECEDNTPSVLKRHRVSRIYDETAALGSGEHSWPQLYNFGFSKARGVWAMYASDDMIFGEGAIVSALRFLTQLQNRVAGGIFFYRNLHSADPQWSRHGIDFTYGSQLLMNYGLIRLDDFQKVGGLDESYRFYCADTDLCLKLYESARRLVPLPNCFVDHDNLMDTRKSGNMAVADKDIALLLKRWGRKVGSDLPQPRRLIWADELMDACNLPAELTDGCQSLDAYWHGLACMGQGLFEDAREGFMQAASQCNHWRIWWHLARAVRQCDQAKTAKIEQTLHTS